MGRKPEVPCAGCGRLMWWSTTLLPEGQATCLPCRRRAKGRGPDEVKPKPKAWVPGIKVCPICDATFEQYRSGQRYCSVDCRESRRRWTAPKAAASQRGYGKVHRETRAKWKPVVDAGRATCCLCGRSIDPGTKWHLDHTPDRTGYRGVAHASCNIRDGARRGRSRQAG